MSESENSREKVLSSVADRIISILKGMDELICRLRAFDKESKCRVVRSRLRSSS